MSVSVEKCFEDAEESGCLQILHKGLKQFPVCVDSYDLLDVTTVDISKNRFVELPQEVLSFVMMESLNSSYNFLKTLPDLSHLSALTVLDVRQNQLQSFPIHLCSLPLKILNASHNRITVLPSEVGLLSKLQLLDLSCNELTNLPSTMGDLLALGSLNIRRNQVVALPDELSKLKNLTKFNFSCNKVSTIPPAFRLISSLIELDLTNNPLLSPPAHICLKGRRHITKYLGLAAEQQEKRWTLMKENQIMRSPSSSSLSSNSPTDLQADVDYEPRERRGTIKYEEQEESVDAVLPSQEPDEKPSLPKQNIAISQQNGEAASADSKNEESHQQEKASELRRSSPSTDKPKVPKKPTSARSSFNEKHRINQEKGKLTPQTYKSRLPSTQSSTSGRLWSGSESSEGSLDRNAVRSLGSHLKSNDDERVKSSGERMDDLAARKEQLLKNKEEILKSKQRLELIKSKSLTRDGSAAATEINAPSPDLDDSDALFEGISKRNPLKPRTPKRLQQDKVINFTMRRMFDSAKEEFELLEKLRESIETRLRIKLPDDLPASLSDGIVLCHLVNHLRKSTISIIHVPSSGVPKLTMPKCQMNVDAFLDACRRAGVTKEDMCTAPDILEEKSPTRLCRTVHALLLAMGDIPPEIVIAQEISLQSPR